MEIDIFRIVANAVEDNFGDLFASTISRPKHVALWQVDFQSRARCGQHFDGGSDRPSKLSIALSLNLRVIARLGTSGKCKNLSCHIHKLART